SQCRHYEAPNQSVDREQICGQKPVRNGAPKKNADIHELPCRNAVGDDDAENNNTEWRKPKDLGRFNKKIEKERQRQGKRQCQDSGYTKEEEFRAIPAGSCSNVAIGRTEKRDH